MISVIRYSLKYSDNCQFFLIAIGNFFFIINEFINEILNFGDLLKLHFLYSCLEKKEGKMKMRSEGREVMED